MNNNQQVTVTRTDHHVRATLETTVQFSYDSVFECEPELELERSVQYPTLVFEEGEDNLDSTGTFESQDITVTGGYTDIVKWVLEVGEWTEVGIVEQIQSIEVDWSTISRTESGI